MEDWEQMAIADPGYESETGARNIPTLTNFETITPVTVVFTNVGGRGGQKKVLNRQGRAICRVMANGGWPSKAIAYIFRVSDWSVTRAIRNQVYKPPRDRIEEDLERAGAHFQGKLPTPPSDARLKELLATPGVSKAPAAISVDSSDESDSEPDSGPSPSRRPQRVSKRKCNTRIQELASDENEVQSAPKVTDPNRTYAHLQGQLAQSMVAEKSRSTVSSKLDSGTSPHSQPSSSLRSLLLPPPRPRPLPLPLPNTSTTQSPAHTSVINPLISLPLPAFLLQALPTVTTDLSPHLALLAKQGFTPPHLCALATWHAHELHEALNDLLMARPSALGHAGLTALTFVRFEVAIRKLVGMARAPRQPSLPRLDTGTPEPLTIFLVNVMGLDLSPHAALLSTQGYDVLGLSAMLALPPTDLRGALQKTLLDPTTGFGEEERAMSLVPRGMKGMSPLEGWAMEFCLRRAVDERE
ncbi:hypothetical protein B0H12DRAFT_1092918 [Mycena haematopus]|nr:hypothetical protein B0H12DRAFT_1092918 [Mycena haematopus]